MPSRAQIAQRYGLAPYVAEQLAGETAAEWEADAAARAQFAQAFSPREPDAAPIEAPIEGLAPPDKPFDNYTDAERAAQAESFERTMREAARRDEQEAQRRAAEANRTPEQCFNDGLTAALRPGAKDARNEALVRLLHPPGGAGR